MGRAVEERAVEARAVEGRAVVGRAVKGISDKFGGGGGGGGGGEKGVGWSIQMTSGSVAMLCQTVEDGCYSIFVHFGQPAAVAVRPAAAAHCL